MLVFLFADDRAVRPSIMMLRFWVSSSSLSRRSWRAVNRPVQYCDDIALEANRGSLRVGRAGRGASFRLLDMVSSSRVGSRDFRLKRDTKVRDCFGTGVMTVPDEPLT